jgi:hypothetical protein
MADRDSALRVLTALRKSPVGDAAVLVGSSGLFGFPTEVPALTEDVDVAVPEAAVARHGREIVDALREQGFEHEAGTATFIGPEGAVFDLLGHGNPTFSDAGAEGYAPVVRQVGIGLARLLSSLEDLDG